MEKGKVSNETSGRNRIENEQQKIKSACHYLPGCFLSGRHTILVVWQELARSPTTAAHPDYKTACTGKMKDPANHPSAIYRGEQICFCTWVCLRAFERDPDPFMAGEVEHPSHENSPE